MCGLAGLYKFKTSEYIIEKEVVQKMANAIQHRGPDREGIFIADPIALVHRRLSILDLSHAGDQPFFSDDKRYSLVYNGEIYNYQLIKSDLIDKGYHFKSSSDTEVILRGFIEYGVKLFSKLNGIYAFALWDREEKKLFLVRDPVGVKPLYYSENSGVLSFASELKALWVDPNFSPLFDYEAIDLFLSFSYVPAPKTGLKGQKQLLPGHYLIAHNGQIKIERFWHWDLKKRERTESDEEIFYLFKKYLFQAVERQLMSDVPVGAFLSGGLDSTAIVTAMHQISSQKDFSLFHYSFSNKLYRETQYAEEVADKFQLTLISQSETKEDLLSLPQKISKHLDSPFADSSAISVYQISKTASQYGKVFLSGDGADEILGGYETYQATALSQKIRDLKLRWLVQSANKLKNYIPKKQSRYSFFQKYSRFTSYAGTPFPEDHAQWRRIWEQEFKKNLYSHPFIAYSDKISMVDSYAQNLSEVQKYTEFGLLDQMLYMDTNFYLSNDMLVKVDRMSMAHGIEVRVPFLDLDFINFCFSLREDFKIRGSEKKFILKKFLSQYFSSSFIQRPKCGFNIPIWDYFKIGWGELLMDLCLTHKSELSLFFNVDKIEKNLKDFLIKKNDLRYELYSILMFVLWLNNLKQRELYGSK